MTHYLDIMTTVSSQIRTLAGQSKAACLPKIPKSVSTIAARINTSMPENKVNPDESVTIDRLLCSHTGREYTTIYTGIATNIAEPVIDKFIDFTEIKDPKKDKKIYNANTAICILIPASCDDESSTIEFIRHVSISVFLGLIGTDSNMTYAAEPDIIRLSNSSKIYIPSYDLEMVAAAFCLANVCINEWFEPEDNTLEYTRSIAELIVGEYDDQKLPPNAKTMLSDIIVKYGSSIGALRDGINTGNLLADLTAK